MATLALTAAGAAIGSAVLPAGVSVLGVTLSGATIGAQIGALAGSAIDASLFSTSGQTRAVQGPRLNDLKVMASTEGAPIPRLYGRMRLGGQVIWALDIEEEAVTEEADGGGKGGSGSSGASASRTDYRYYGTFAVAICEGEISRLGRVWADGQELDLSQLSYRLHTGSESQAPDPTIAAHLGGDSTPAYRGVAYVVLERLPLADFGNRLPQLSFEVARPVDDFQQLLRGVVLIPGSGEFTYASEPVTRDGFAGERIAENVHTRSAATDIEAAIDQLAAELPNVRSVSLVVCWFGTDLRAGQCQILPGVERTAKDSQPLTWRVGDVTRDTAYVVSQRDGRPAYGGTPSDETVIRAIELLKARGYQVTLTPFILMDVPQANSLADPYTGAGSQPAYPWRGRITVDPAPGRAGTPDKTAAAISQIDAVIGSAMPAHFSIASGVVSYAGPAEWSLRRQVLHYAHLAQLAGGVDAFLIGTELRGLTWVRSGPSSYPFVDRLVALAADVKSVVGAPTKVVYAADWSEFFGHQPADGTGDVHFHLDPLWACPWIDAIGIDLYWPLSDWRQGAGHLDRVAGARSIYDLDYLKSNIAGGEGYDWYYASQAVRDAQVRTPITDGAGKPWVFRYKDLKSWWLNAHFNRPGGVESSVPTSWVPASKPVWLMETGCPAADKGANQPNVFYDPKSSESALPYYSSGRRDDFMQRRYLQALVEAYDTAHPGRIAALNPVSPLYGGPMVDPARIHAYCWDARPYPAFPNDEETWGDGPNWRLGHWLTGRLAGVPLAAAVAAILNEYGFGDHDTSQLAGVVPGYVLDRVMSAREALQPLELAYFFDAIESGGQIRFQHRGAGDEIAIAGEGDLVEARPGAPLATLTRGQETELPASAKVSFVSAEGDYRPAVAEARRLAGASGRVAQAELAIVLDPEQASEIAETWLFEAWAARERAALALPPSLMAVEPGDVIALGEGARPRRLRIAGIADHGVRDIDAMGIDAAVYSSSSPVARTKPKPAAVTVGRPSVEMLDLPLLRAEDEEAAGYVAASLKPWPGAVAIYRSAEEAGFTLAGLITRSAVMGRTIEPLPAGPTSRIDRAQRMRVKLDHGELQSVSRIRMLGGANALGLRNSSGVWEVMQFETATLVAPLTYELSGLLRGQAGSEGSIEPLLAAGARVVVLDSALVSPGIDIEDIGVGYRWRIGPSGRALGHPDFVETTHAFKGRGLVPLSPVHVRGSRSSGDLTVTWIRRTRRGGDGWEVAEVPLAEDGEAYDVEILDGLSVKRSSRTALSRLVYPAFEQVNDFGAVQAAVSVRVRQVSAVMGPGAPVTAVV